jgi:small GTP-binding protein
MASIDEKIKEIEEEIRNTPYNKATQHHIGRLKAKIARLREEGEKKTGGTAGPSYGVRRSGDATVVLVGFPSVGKSTLLNKLTSASSQVGEYDFTTLDVIPGAMEYRGAKIQVLDVPGLIEGAASGRGRGKEVISVVRNSDLILIILDVNHTEQLKVVEKELQRAGIRINKKPPKIRIKKTSKGGIRLGSTVPLTNLNEKIVKAVLAEYKVHNADVLIREDSGVEDLIDAIARNRVYIPAKTIINKIDVASENKLSELIKTNPDSIMISADKGANLDTLNEEIYKSLRFIHVYMKPQGKEADMEEPLIIKKGSNVEDVCNKLHRDFKNRFRYARVWGDSVRYRGQRVGLEHLLKEGDILSLILEK